MDALLQTLGVQTLNYAVRSGVALTSKYAVQQCARLLESVDDKMVRVELQALKTLLDSKIKIISPALDLIQFRSGRGNAFLQSAVPLARSLHREIVHLGRRLDNAATAGVGIDDSNHKGHGCEAQHAELVLIIKDIKDLLQRIDRDIPLLQLAITASGEKMSSTLTPGISPSRLMQASALLSFADAQFAMTTGRPIQVGPSFTLSLYMLFLGHSQLKAGSAAPDSSPSTPASSEYDASGDGVYGLEEGKRKPIWQEVMHKCRARLCRIPVGWEFDATKGYRPRGVRGAVYSAADVPEEAAVALPELTDGYSYYLEIIEDLTDGRLHDGGEHSAQAYDGLAMAGIRESIPIHQISKIFYTDIGRVLNIGNNDENNPVLLFKRDANAKSPIKLRQEWFDGSEAESSEESQCATTNNLFEFDDQDDIDKQLWEETIKSAGSPCSWNGPQRLRLPPHLDPEWLALEVCTDDKDDELDVDADEDEESTSESHGDSRLLTSEDQGPRNRPSVDAEFMDQLRRLSIGNGSPTRGHMEQPVAHQPQERYERSTGSSHVGRSPFESIASSLSLLEMLIRLTSLQEFQQTSHLAIPDHILMFFLEETSTTGLQGDAHRRMRSEAKRRMGFDPYTDTLPGGRRG